MGMPVRGEDSGRAGCHGEQLKGVDSTVEGRQMESPLTRVIARICRGGFQTRPYLGMTFQVRLLAMGIKVMDC